MSHRSAGGGVLDGVREQVGDYLSDAVAITNRRERLVGYLEL